MPNGKRECFFSSSHLANCIDLPLVESITVIPPDYKEVPKRKSGHSDLEGEISSSIHNNQLPTRSTVVFPDDLVTSHCTLIFITD
jgi:hypothetical protein